MPARTERIAIIPGADGAPVRAVRFPVWWDRGAFIEAFKAREVDTGNPVDWNLAWLLSAGEALAWDARSRAAFAAARPADHRTAREDMRQFEALLRGAAWIIVESVEWESGLS
jgi:hypothetical protein